MAAVRGIDRSIESLGREGGICWYQTSAIETFGGRAYHWKRWLCRGGSEVCGSKRRRGRYGVVLA